MQELLTSASQLLDNNQPRSVIELLDDRTLESQNESELYRIRGLAHAQLSNFHDAIIYLAKATSLADNNALAWRHLGTAHAYAGNLSDAITALSKAIHLDPQDEEAHYSRGYIYSLFDKNELSLQDFNNVLERNPVNFRAMIGQGHGYMQLGNYASAIGAFDRIISAGPFLAEAYYGKGAAQYCRGEYQQAIENINSALAIDSEHSGCYFYRGCTYWQLNEHIKALADFNTAYQLYPSYPTLHLQRGKVYSALDQPNEAIKDLSEEIATDPASAEALFERGNNYQKVKNYTNAIDDYDKAAALPDFNPLVYCNRGTAYAHLGRHQEAIRDFERYLESDPNLAVIYYYLGRSYAYIRDLNKSIENYTKAILRDSSFHDAYTNRGLLYLRSKKYNLALADFGTAIRLKPDNSETFFERGNVYAAVFEYELALADYVKALTLNESDPTIFSSIGSMHRELGNFKLAIENYDKAIILDPEFSRSYHGRGVAHLAIGNFPQAIEDFTTGIAKFPEDAAAFYGNRGLVYSNTHEYEKAFSDFNEAIRLDPENGYNFNNRGALYNDIEEFGSALDDYLQAIKLSPEIAWPWYGLSGLDQDLLSKKTNLFKSNCINRATFLLTPPQISQAATAYSRMIYRTLEYEAPMLTVSLLLRGGLLDANDIHFPTLLETLDTTRLFRQQFSLWKSRRDHPSTSLLAEAILQFYMGNPVETYRIIKRQVENESPLPLAAHYYFAQAAGTFLEPHGEILEQHALPLARKVLEASPSEEREKYYAALVLDLCGYTTEAIDILATLHNDGFSPAWYKLVDIEARPHLNDDKKLEEYARKISLQNTLFLQHFRQIDPVIITGSEASILDELFPLVHVMESKEIIAMLLAMQEFGVTAHNEFDRKDFFSTHIRFQHLEEENANHFKTKYDREYQLVYGTPVEKEELDYDITNYVNRKENAWLDLGGEIHAKSFTAYMYRKENYKSPVSINLRKYLILVSNLYEQNILSDIEGHLLHQYLYYCLQKIAAFHMDEGSKLAINEAKNLIDTAQVIGFGYGTIESAVRYTYHQLKGKESPLISFEAFLEKISPR